MTKDLSDFKNWLTMKPNFKKIAFDYNTKKKYQEKQDLAAIFLSSYNYCEEKFVPYFEEYQKIPKKEFSDLIFEFRKRFPKDKGRILGVSYFDDLLELLIEKYEAIIQGSLGNNESSQKLESKNANSNYLHPHIFKSNAFEVWQSMFDSFEIKESSRTDVKFMFEKMKKDGLIRNNIREVDFLKWVNDTYELTVQKISFANPKSTKRLAIYNLAKVNYIK